MKMHKKHFKELAEIIRDVEFFWRKPYRYEQLKMELINFLIEYGDNFDKDKFNEIINGK